MTAYQNCFARAVCEKDLPQSLMCQKLEFHSCIFSLRAQKLSVGEVPSETQTVTFSCYQAYMPPHIHINKLNHLPILNKGQTCLQKSILDFSFVSKDANKSMVLHRLIQRD